LPGRRIRGEDVADTVRPLKVEQEQIDNLNVKTAICEELEKHIEEKTASVELLHDLQDRDNSIGFVPRKDISAVKNRYHEAVQKFVNTIRDLSQDDKSRVLLENQLSDLRKDPMADRKIFQKELAIRKKITKVENDIALWRNNLEFFGKSQNAAKVRDEFNDKIKSASEHLQQLKQQLKLLRTV
jgi:bacterioferritin (cytochrome b1)